MERLPRKYRIILPGAPNKYSMVTVAQLVEPRVVILVVVGSSPISHPIFSSQIRGR